MKIQLFAFLIGLSAVLGSCNKKSDSRLMGIIGSDDSTEALDVPGYSVSIQEAFDSKTVAYCNGVKLQDGRFLSALHCFGNHKPGASIVTSGGIAHELSREVKADLFIGQMTGGVAPSVGAKLYDGILPLSVDLEAHWFDPVSSKWRFSKGHAKRSSASDMIWHHDLDLNPGASGAGLFFVDDNGERFLVGLHVGFAKKTNNNVGIVISKNFDENFTSLSVGVEYEAENDVRFAYVCSNTGECYAAEKPPVIVICIPDDCPVGEGGGGNGDGGDGGGNQGGDGGGNQGGDGGGNQGGDGGGNQGGDGGGNQGDDGGGNQGDDGGGNQGGGIIIGYPGAGGNNGGNPGGGSGESTGGGGSGYSSGKLSDGRTCYACKSYTPEADDRSLFKPECDDDSGFTGLFGQKTPSMDSITLQNFRMTQTKLTESLRRLAEKMLAEKKWKTPDGMPSKISQLSDETRKRLENWLNQVVKSADDYYAMVISSLGNVSKPAQPQFDDTAEGIKRTRQYLEFLKKQISENPDEFSDRRYSLLDASAQFLQVADIQYKTGNPEQAYLALQMSIAAADVSISVTPIAGWAKDVYEGWTGYSFTSGKKLSRLEHSLAIGGAVSAGILGAVGTSAKVFAAGAVVFKDAAKLSKSAEQLAEIEKATESLLEMSKSAEEAGVSAEMLGEGLRSTQRVLQEGKHVETVAHDGRTVYKLKDLELGAPKIINEGNQYKSVRDKVAQGMTNADLMRDGKAPIGSDGEWVNLHHVFGAEPGTMIEMEASAHRSKYDEFHKLIGESFRKDPVLRAQYAKFRRDYWMNRL
jgi:DNA-binding PadR family transcriptional regulator